MLEGALHELRVGDPRALATDVGPVIDAEALAARPGPIVSATALPADGVLPLERLLTETSIAVNPAAAGGNRTLMTIG